MSLDRPFGKLDERSCLDVSESDGEMYDDIDVGLSSRFQFSLHPPRSLTTPAMLRKLKVNIVLAAKLVLRPSNSISVE